MLSLVNFINRALTSLFDLILAPFSSVAPIWAIIALSLVSGVLLVLLYGRFSAQRSIKEVKRKIYGCLLEAVLYRNDIVTSLKAQGRMLRYAFVYLALAIPPLVILAIPCLLVLAQINMRFNARPLAIGESITMRLDLDDAALLGKARLEGSTGLDVSPPLRVQNPPQVWWKITAHENGARPLALTLDGSQILTEQIYVATKPVRFWSRFSRSWSGALLYPEGASVGHPPASVQGFELLYPAAHYKLFGFPMHWIVIFFIVSLVSGLLAAKAFKIEV